MHNIEALRSPSYLHAQVTPRLPRSSASPQTLHRRFPSNHSQPTPQSLNLLSGNEMTDLQHISPQKATAQLIPTTYPLQPTSNPLQTQMNNAFPTTYSYSPMQKQDSPFGDSPYGISSQENIVADKNLNDFGNIEPMYAPAALGQSEPTLTSESEKDPFLSLLEQLAENERSNIGPSDLDYYLAQQNA